MKTFEINYSFEGYGTVKIEANSKKEAQELFYNGEYDVTSEAEWGDNYQLENIKECK